ncbi:CTP synthase [bacterium AB1]|nr:CTP synthase [bacterium AB1]
MTKILFLCGGSLSGIGKGTISAIIYNILQKNNIKCKYIKIDPYLNINIEHMDSKEHGLYYKINNNYYGDVDLYYLSRHCNIDETNSVSLGKIIQLMHQHSDSTKTLQVINNIVDTFIKFYFCNIDDYDIVIIEHGGTYRCDEENFTTYIIEYLVKHYETYNIFISPIMSVGGEHKTKNIQYSVLNIYENFKSRLIILRDLNNYYVEKYILKKIYNRLQTRNVENVVSLPWVKDVFFLQNYLHDDIYSFLKNIFNLKSINKLDNLVIKSPSHEINIYILTQHKSNVFNYD